MTARITFGTCLVALAAVTVGCQTPNLFTQYAYPGGSESGMVRTADPFRNAAPQSSQGPQMATAVQPTGAIHHSTVWRPPAGVDLNTATTGTERPAIWPATETGAVANGWNPTQPRGGDSSTIVTVPF